MGKSNTKEREQGILDAALGLFIHYGYDKTTIADIASTAGISKGAIYLHFTSKTELFDALLMREMEVYAESWLDLTESDPNGGTIGGMYKNMLYALTSSPLISAMFRQDKNVLGNYLRKLDYRFRDVGSQSMRHEFIEMMQKADAVRRDVDPKVTAHIMDMLGYGLISMGKFKDEKDIPPMEDIIEGIADFMDRALMPEGGGNNEIGKVIIRQIADATRHQLKKIENEKRSDLSDNC